MSQGVTHAFSPDCLGYGETQHVNATAHLVLFLAGQDFIASPRFVWALPGYVFAKRDVGLGYHRDAGVSMSDVCDTSLQPKPQQLSSIPLQRGEQQPQQPAPKYLLRPRLVSLAAAEELD